MTESDKIRFEELMLPHLDRLHGLARTLTRNLAEADDLVQETYIRAFRGFGNFELRECGARPWLMRILCNAFYSSRSRRRREPTLAEDINFDDLVAEVGDAPLEPLTAGVLDWDHFDEELKQAVQELQVEHQTVLLLWSIDRLTYREIADVCGCPIGTVMSRLYRARQFLCRRLRTYVQDRKLQNERNIT
jgi:RNA polymerase sigma-70 factor (ECF subfamily)